MRLVTVVLMLLFAAFLRAQELPPAPKGFSWQSMPELKSALLKPDGWHVKHESRGDTTAYFVSKEEIRDGVGFTTGISFECVGKVDRKAGVSPAVYIAKYADEAAKRNTLLERRSFRQGPFDAVRFRYVSAPAKETSVTIVNLLIANDKTGTVFVVIFEAPTATWDMDAQVGDVILKKLFLDDEI